MEELITNVANFGFPIVLSMYLLTRIEGKLDTLSQAIDELTKTIISTRD